MFYTDNQLQFPVRVETPDPQFARALQQAIGGVEGEIRVAMQYFFQACGARGNPNFRDLLMNTAAEELGHIEMLATAVASISKRLRRDEGRSVRRSRGRRDPERHQSQELPVRRPVGHACRQRRACPSTCRISMPAAYRRRHDRQCDSRIHRSCPGRPPLQLTMIPA